LACGYHGRIVLCDVGLRVQAGEIVAILGPNGAGKSTLLKTICKTLPPIAGSVRVADMEIGRLSDREVARKIGYVPQEEAAVFPFTVREVVAMGRIPYATGIWESAQDHRIVDHAIEVADCGELAERPVTELSGGEKQRVLIARALAQEADVLLMDEPTSHLDVRHQLSVANLMQDLASRGKAILAAVHDLNLAAQFADRAVLLAQGTKRADGPLELVLQSPDLDRAYEVKFTRLRDDEGRLHVFGSVAANGKRENGC
jgi:iron complex transport system ATP-binding protein